MERDRPDIVVFPPALFAGAVGLALVLEWLLPLGLLPPAGAGAAYPLGLALIGVALAIAVWSIGAFRRAGTSADPRRPALHLVDSGPFRYSRNPMYIGLLTLLAGIGLAGSLDWALLALPIVFAVLHFGVVLREEAYLRAKFGAPYVAYLGRTRRWL